MLKATGFYCRHCSGRMFTGQQYYAFQKNYIDLTCIKCSSSIDVEVRKLNKVLGVLGFKKLEERYELANQDSHK
jgi:hypothetical protein